ncbi:fructose-bisphosphate aldolase class I [Phormidium tenue FACHB-886]|nr:fructose-bisphosphate aldolase class I [Phormidium tenue FACHB-886]
MSAQEMVSTAKTLVALGKGILAMDESNSTLNKRFEQIGIAPTVENRRAYRELIVTTPGLGNFLSSAILYDETIRQSTKDGVPFIKILLDAGIIPGIKLDTGKVDLAGHPGEQVIEGLDGLRSRIAEYYKMGIRSSKWRAVFTISKNTPSRGCIEANAHALARFAALSQEGGLVPIVEPEVLMDGDHTIERCLEVTQEVLRTVFNQLYTQRVVLEQMILKPNMVISGQDSSQQASIEEVADATVTCLLRTVPAAVPGIAFLSGGQSSELAAAHLNAMQVKYGEILSWSLTYSYSRAIEQPVMELWKRQETNVREAQQMLLHWVRCNSAASNGTYSEQIGRSAEPTGFKQPKLVSQD